eukprot:CAMPEP_0194318694 /NCGR_PEP_ID=MMETSP0171-20130528/15262_1 /TAXON_ID=218684 /ORGANISM="Corethron pennatum, Strain L29A3" /LENGTH=310 /DNA_ID=CAMNT_0039075675 /DNA_START=154 /DNA_END=1086 /DNA_ORIENTATION=+
MVGVPPPPPVVNGVEYTTVAATGTAKSLKDTGNDAFASGNYAAAARSYSEALSLLSAPSGGGGGSDLLPVLYNNRAASLLRLDQNKDAERDCTEALAATAGGRGGDASVRQRVKALYRRASARLLLENYRGALEDALEALSIDGKNREVQGLVRKIKITAEAPRPVEMLGRAAAVTSAPAADEGDSPAAAPMVIDPSISSPAADEDDVPACAPMAIATAFAEGVANKSPGLDADATIDNIRAAAAWEAAAAGGTTDAATDPATDAAAGPRSCRCPLCGIEIVAKSEAECTAHFNECPAFACKFEGGAAPS